MMMISRSALAALLCAAATGACGGDGETDADRLAAEPARERTEPVQVYGDPESGMSPADLERGRLDESWRRVVEIDTIPEDGGTTPPEEWEDIGVESVNRSPTQLPLRGDVSGPSVLTAQILLDRALFSPGIIDGRWGKNTEKAVYWFQSREGLSRTGHLDPRTFERLREVAGNPRQLVRAHTLSEEEVAGPFVTIPDDIYEKAEMDCMCYESLSEKLSELFHTSADVLRKLNPDVDLDELSAGDRIFVPAIRDERALRDVSVDRLVISDGGFYLHAVDPNGRILFHFPTTLGSAYSPSPTGDYRVTAIAEDPTWHYQPDLLEGIPDHEEDAIIPPGPNNAVGVVWMQLSKPHYGIHGTSAPETIGYVTSNGCVRLTNWDAEFLSARIEDGVPVEFRDVDNPGGRADAA